MENNFLNNIKDALFDCNKSFSRDILFPTMIPGKQLHSL